MKMLMILEMIIHTYIHGQENYDEYDDQEESNNTDINLH